MAQAGPSLTIDVAANRHPISPDIYGLSYYWNGGDAGEAAANRASVRRWGGNATSAYNWKLDITNLAADWFFEVLPSNSVDASKLPAGSSFNRFADQTLISGAKIFGAIPILGMLPKARVEACSFDVARYGAQCKTDPYAQYHPYNCGNGIAYATACGTPTALDGRSPSSPVYLKNDPNDVYAVYDENFQGDWIRSLITRYGTAGQGGVAFWSLDNEPIWWDYIHRDIHPDPYTYDELIEANIRYAAAIKKADPTAQVTGPVGDNWASLWLSKKDIVAGQAKNGRYWSNPVDRNAHGGVALVPWYLQQMRNYERDHGVRVLDYLDLHAYIEPSSIHASTSTDALNALRLDSTREFWDPTYVVSGDFWIRDVDNNGAPIAPWLIPRLREMVNQNYPGTKIAITEYNWTSQNTLNGGLAQAELLGVFGREGVDMANLWGPPKPTDPGAFAFRMFRNYDGMGGAFGETGVQAGSAEAGKLSVFAAVRSDLNLTVLVINKTAGDLTSTVALTNFNAGAFAKVWRYSGAKLDAIVAQPDLPVSDDAFSGTFPGNSITMLVIEPGSLPAPKPVVTGVTSAASYGSAIAPGQIVTVWGTGLGPQSLTGLSVDGRGMVSTSSGEARILFDGIPAPMIYASASVSSASVPYFGASRATTHVQVEFRGVRSDPFEVPVSATAPGLFTLNASGKGQGAIFNGDGLTVNSARTPAKAGSLVILWATGEGVTDPPGVDGRPAGAILPKPVAPISVEIGGVTAQVEYAGAAPGNMPGLLQINARIAGEVAAGDSVPVKIKVGSGQSQEGVTLAVY